MAAQKSAANRAASSSPNQQRTLSLVEALTLAESSIETMRKAIDPLNSEIYREFREIAQEIARAKSDIGGLQANDIRTHKIPEAGRELNAVVDATEEATHRIMECAETIMTADPSNPATYHNVINENLMAIFEACSFQDITGQRTQKVVHVLRYLEASLHSMIEIWQPDEAAEPSAPPAVEAQRTSAPQLDQKDDAEGDLQQGQVDNVFSERDLESFLQETAFQNDTVGDAGSPLYAAPVADFTVSHQTAPHAPANIKPAEGAAHESAEPAAQPPPSRPGPAAAPAPAPAAQGEATLAPMPAPETGNAPGPLSATDPAAPENAGVVREGDYKRPTALSVQTLNDTQKAVLFNAPPHL